jgi:hypothetical protein
MPCIDSIASKYKHWLIKIIYSKNNCTIQIHLSNNSPPTTPTTIKHIQLRPPTINQSSKISSPKIPSSPKCNPSPSKQKNNIRQPENPFNILQNNPIAYNIHHPIKTNTSLSVPSNLSA